MCVVFMSDQIARERALSADESFIVSAPAGSGKTETLTARVLALLARVNEPEEILCVTFTRKAAEEMRERILRRLEEGAEAALAALKQNEAQGWDLVNNPARLRIMTFDALCMNIVAMMPFGSTLAVSPKITEFPQLLYKQAATAVLAEPESKDFLRYLDNRKDMALSLLCSWLAQRANHDMNYSLEEQDKLFEAIAAKATSDLKKVLGPDLHVAVQACALAGHELGLQDFASFMLTKDKLRKRFDKRQGFGPGTEQKSMLDPLLKAWAEDDLAEYFIAVRDMPAALTGEVRDFAEQFFKLLPRLIAHLKVVFAQSGTVDFTEVMLTANRILDIDNPSELLLKLDYKLQHVLVDEFQDTSMPQYELLLSLTHGFTPGDGRTVFVVGDPMQSIYSFRGGQVGLFLHVEEHGLGDIALEPLKFTRNFRTQERLVNSVSDEFGLRFPPSADLQFGQVPFSVPQAVKDAEDNSVFELVGDISGIGELVATLEGSVGILLRTRRDLLTVQRALQAKGISVALMDGLPLMSTQEVLDAYSVYKYLYQGCEQAKIALLLSPVIGLTVAELDDDNEHVLEKINLARENIGRLPVAQMTRALWSALGFAELLDEHKIANCELFFDALDKATDGNTVNIEQLELALTTTFPAVPPGRINLMTIHKSKGLEFDHVIVVQSTPRRHTPALLATSMVWHDGRMHAVCAPMRSAGTEPCAAYNYIQSVNKQRQSAEGVRLDYVAATRAKRSLYWFGQWDGAPQIELKAKEQSNLSAWRKLAKPTLNQTQAIKLNPPETISQYYEANKTNTGMGRCVHQILEWSFGAGRFFCADELPVMKAKIKHWANSFCIDADKLYRVIEKMAHCHNLKMMFEHSARAEVSVLEMKDKLRVHRIDCMFVKDGHLWIIDHKTETERDEHWQQLLRYSKLVAQLEDLPIMLGVYFPLTGELITKAHSDFKSNIVQLAKSSK